MGKMDRAETDRGVGRLHSLKTSGVTTQVRGPVSPEKLDGQSFTVALSRGDSQALGLLALLSPQYIFTESPVGMPGAGGTRGSNHKIMDPKKIAPYI